MRFERIVGPSILGIVLAALPGVALAAQILGLILAVGPALAVSAHGDKARPRASARTGALSDGTGVAPAGDRSRR